MMNVLAYSGYPPASYADGGGALAIWYGLSAIAKVEGIDLTVAFPMREEDSCDSEGVHNGVKVRGIRSPKELADCLREARPDIFHCMRSESLEALKSCRSLGIPSIYEVRSPKCFPCKWQHKLVPPYHRQWKEMLAGRKDRLAARQADVVIVPSETAIGNLRRNYGIPEERSLYFYNGVDYENFYPLEEKPDNEVPILINAGRLARDRHFDLLLKAFQLIQREFPLAQLRIVGDGPERARLEQICVDKSIDGVRFFGVVSHSELADLYRTSDILMNSSESESFGNVVAEAMACGLPVVCFKAGSLQELVIDPMNGILCEIGDDETLASNAMTLIRNPEMRKTMGLEAARSCRERFSWDLRAAGIVELYGKLSSGGNIF